MGNMEELIQFIVEAKRSAYASGGSKLEKPSRPGAKDLPYTSGSYSYLDSYYGEVHFAGQEIVWHHGNAKWSMNYFGFTHDPVTGFPEFLNACLREVDESAPFRGPAKKTDELFEYVCTWSGDISRFSGEEHIVYQGQTIFSLSFHGGLIQYA